MAADESRAQRIRDLKDRHPEITWRVIAAELHVSERAAQEWRATGGIAYDNAQGLNRIFQQAGEQITDDYIWRGEPSTPDPFRLSDQIEDVNVAFREDVNEIKAHLAQVEQMLAAATSERERIAELVETQNQNLARQTSILHALEQERVENAKTLERIEGLVFSMSPDEVTQRLVAALRSTG